MMNGRPCEDPYETLPMYWPGSQNKPRAECPLMLPFKPRSRPGLKPSWLSDHPRCRKNEIQYRGGQIDGEKNPQTPISADL
jgi:hypothetical protein